MKELNLKKSVYELVQEYPEVKEIMADLGFAKITSSKALQVMGRIMTIPRGAAVMNVPMDKVIERFKDEGFTVTGLDNTTAEEDNVKARAARIKTYIERLSNGEPLASVRKDFVQEFQSVTALEVAEAEQELIKDGVPMKQVQKLCDVHSAMFHGRSEAEVMKEELKARKIQRKAVRPPMVHVSGSSIEATDYDKLPAGHPINLLRLENTALEKIIADLQAACAPENQPDGKAVLQLLIQFNGIRSHYAKKEEILMPVLYENGVTGPSQVMWGVDDEIKKEIGMLTRAVREDADNAVIYKGRIYAVAQRAKEMIFKEEQILFPLSLRFFKDEDWKVAYRDCVQDVGMAIIEDVPKWDEGEAWLKEQNKAQAEQGVLNGKVQLPTGEVSVKELSLLFKLLPVDITYVDADDKVRFFVNEGRVFTRPVSVLGRDILECHPPQIIPVVRNLMDDFKAKHRRDLEVARYINDKPVLVHYMGVYDENDDYIGTLEVVQDCSHIFAKFPQRK